MSLFPVPVSGQQIPRGWFARLVRFMNSMVLHGDGSYTEVKHTDDGTFVTLTNAARDALNRASGRPGGSGGTPTPVAPDFNNPTSVVAGTQYGPFNHPVWLIGDVGVLTYDAISYDVELNYTASSTGVASSITLFRIGFQINVSPVLVMLYNPVSFLIPPSTPFFVSASTTAPQNLRINLNYYPLI